MTTDTRQRVPDFDNFSARLALVRHGLGAWNVAKTARLCDVSDESWRRWERGERPQDFEAVCRKISAATGYDLMWLMAGGGSRTARSSTTAARSGRAVKETRTRVAA